MSGKIRIVNRMTCFTPADELLIRPNYIMRSIVAHQWDSATAPYVWYRYGQLHWINTSPARRLSQYRVSILILNSNIAKIFPSITRIPGVKAFYVFAQGTVLTWPRSVQNMKIIREIRFTFWLKKISHHLIFYVRFGVMAYPILQQPTGWYQIYDSVP